ncbi:ATP-binding cassette domain-containing protein [Streptomyces sp. NPDC093591]|uniref:ATP-binding cassette domain-containing protein n=1 Tax=Streptomyces sp. NPDC093591 TaxID=3366044 RepID=UPI0037F7D40C
MDATCSPAWASGGGARGLLSVDRALDFAGLSLEVRAGEVFGYLGPNGAGKSTTIRLLLDLIRPNSGGATVLGLDPRTDGVALRRRVGILREGCLVALDAVANLRAGAVRDIEITFAEPVTVEDFARLPGVHDVVLDPAGTTLRGRLAGEPDALVKAAARHHVTALRATEPALGDLFHAYYADAVAAPHSTATV